MQLSVLEILQTYICTPVLDGIYMYSVVGRSHICTQTRCLNLYGQYIYYHVIGTYNCSLYIYYVYLSKGWLRLWHMTVSSLLTFSNDFILLFQSHQYTYCIRFLCFSTFRCNMMFIQLCLPSLKYINVLWEGRVPGTEMNNHSNDQLLFLFILRSISISGSVNGYFLYVAAIYINFWGKTHLI